MNCALSSLPVPAVRKLPAWLSAASTLEAIRLIELGARAGLVHQLTGIDQTSANRLYREVHRCPSPAGQAPFTDTWYRRSEYRMLHAALVWKLYQRFGESAERPARRLIDVYETYLFLVQEPRLNITHVAFVPDLIKSNLWMERECATCRTAFSRSHETARDYSAPAADSRRVSGALPVAQPGAVIAKDDARRRVQRADGAIYNNP